MAIWWPHSLTCNLLTQLRTSKQEGRRDLKVCHLNSSNKAGRNVDLGSVIFFDMSQPPINPKIWRKTTVIALPKPINQLMIRGAALPYCFNVCHTNSLSASSWFVLGHLLTFKYQITKLVLNAVARLFNRQVNWSTTSRFVLRKSAKLVSCLLISRHWWQPITLHGTSA